MAQATSMTTKSLFKGLGKREHVFSSKMGNLTLDLSVQSKPKLYLEGVDELTGSARSVYGVSISRFLTCAIRIRVTTAPHISLHSNSQSLLFGFMNA